MIRTNHRNLAGPLAAILMSGGAMLANPALAADGDPIDIEVPAVITDVGTAGEAGGEADNQLDLANVVQSAAKGLTTVQEAPVIVTVITSDEIRDRQFQTLDQVLDAVPGYMRLSVLHGLVPAVSVRGNVQAVQLLNDSLSLFEPYLNNVSFGRSHPLELIKRIEVISGPGGVLWGSNSLLGVVNVITKDAEDVDGIEVGGQLGDGNGDRRNARVFAIAGLPDLLDGKAKLLVHTSFESYRGPGYEMPLMMFSAPLPQPNSANFYGPLTQADPPQSYILNLFAKATYGKLQVRVSAPFIERHNPLGFPGSVTRQHLPEDDDPTCTPDVEYDPSDRCLDRGRRARDNRLDYSDRYAVAELRTRTAGGKAGVGVKVYGQQFVRNISHLGILAPVPVLLEGGLSVRVDNTSYRVGTAFDGDVELPNDLRVSYGAEAFREFAPNSVKRARQGDGIEAEVIAPYRLDRLPLPCPREPDPTTEARDDVRIIAGCPLTFLFPSTRSVGGIYVNPQWKPTKKLILDAGARLQVSPESLGTLHYPLTSLFSGTAVWNFIPDWHLKLNLAQGFRPPTFLNLQSNGESVTLEGSPDLSVETSDAAQAEVNARLFKGDRRIRELSFRADYSYTRMENLIQLNSGEFVNSAERGIHSAEGLAKLYVQGGHRFEFAYTFTRLNTRDKGIHKAVPEHMFHLAGIYNLMDDKLTAFTDLRVVGAMEDANRLVEHRDFIYCEQLDGGCPATSPRGTVVNSTTMQSTPLRSHASSVTLDRLPAAADLSFGMAYTPTPKLTVRATVFNAFNARYYHPDTFFDYEPRLEFLPNPMEDVRGYLSAQYMY